VAHGQVNETGGGFLTRYRGLPFEGRAVFGGLVFVIAVFLAVIVEMTAGGVMSTGIMVTLALFGGLLGLAAFLVWRGKTWAFGVSLILSVLLFLTRGRSGPRSRRRPA
jgi:hypothetical protein